MRKGEIKTSRSMLDSVTKEIPFSELSSESMRVRELRNLSKATLKTYKTRKSANNTFGFNF